MPFVLDCSVTMAWLFPDEANERTDALRDSLLTDRALVPSLWAIEVANVLLVATRRGRMQRDEWPALLGALFALPITTDPETAERALTAALALAHAHQLPAYDAVYLELAVRRELPLATLDRELAAACRKAGVPVLV